MKVYGIFENSSGYQSREIPSKMQLLELKKRIMVIAAREFFNIKIEFSGEKQATA